MQLPKVNQRVEVEIEQRAGTRFRTWVEAVRPPLVTIAAPMEGEHLIVLQPGQPVVIHYRDDRGRYAAVARVRERTDGLPSVELVVDRVDRLQLREFFRWSGSVDVRYLVLAEGEEVDPASTRYRQGWRATKTLDLSGGGLGVSMGEPVAMGTRVILALHLPSSKEPVYAEGQVVRVQEEAQARSKRYKVGIEFTRIGESARSRIMGFLFRQEVRFRRL